MCLHWPCPCLPRYKAGWGVPKAVLHVFHISIYRIPAVRSPASRHDTDILTKGSTPVERRSDPGNIDNNGIQIDENAFFFLDVLDRFKCDVVLCSRFATVPSSMAHLEN